MKIVIRSQGKVVREITVADGAELSVGRQPDVNDIVLDDIKASRKHGRLTCSGNTLTFTDLGSGNGTWKGEERLSAETPVELAPGEPVVIGSHALAVEEGEAVDPGAPTDPSSRQRAVAVVAEGKAGMLSAVGGNVDKQSFGLGTGSVVIGRIPECAIQINDSLSSRKNTEIVREGAQYKVRDLGSTNGTFLNEEKITEADLAEGDVVRIGEIKLTFSVVDAASAPPVPQPKPAAAAAGAPAVAGDAPSTGASPAAAGGGGGGLVAAGVIAVIVIAGAAGYLLFFRTNEDPVGPAPADPRPPVTDPQPQPAESYPVRLGRPETLDMAVTLKKTGDVTAWKRSDITLPVGAKVEEVHVKNGDQVKVDQPLVTLELTEQLKTELRNQKLALSKAKEDVEKARRAVEIAQSNLKKAREDLKIAQDAYNRDKPLYDKGNLLQKEWDGTKRRLNAEKTSVSNAVRQLDQRTREVRQFQDTVAQVEKSLDEIQSRIDDLTHKAKIAGVVSGMDLKKGYIIKPANRAVSIIQYERQVKVVVAVPEDDIALVKEGMAADVWLSKAPDRVFRGTVTLIPATAEQRNYDVELKVPNRDKHLRPGAQAMVRFVVDVHEDALAVPSAVVSAGKRGAYFVYRYVPATESVEQVPVKVGVETLHEGRKFTELLPAPDATRTIAPADRIVFDGAKNLRDGVGVEVKNPQAVGLE